MSMICASSFRYTPGKGPKIVVVGAGLAGLTTAYRLHTAGMEVDVYEARNRVGGRILTIKLNNQIIELGAQTFTNPLKHPHLYSLIKEFGLEIFENRAPLNYSYFDGKKLTPLTKLLEKLHFDSSVLHNKLIEISTKSTNMKEVLKQLVIEDSPLFKIMAIKLAIYEGATIESLSTQYVQTLSNFLNEAISLKTKKDEDCYIDRSSIKNGNGMLPEKIASYLSPHLNLNRCLVKVSKNSEGFILTFDNSQKVRADILILAIPCSLYQNIDFEETVIPSNKLQVINAIKYGTNSKLFIPVYNTTDTILGLASDQIYGNFDSFREILAINFTDEIGVNSGEKLAFIYELVRPMIEKVFSIQPFAIPSCAEDRSFVTYGSPIGYSWLNDPYAKGSYSYISPGQENALMSITEEYEEKFKSLFAPIHGLYFAGEHASISEVHGTMEAACESGERVARMILKKFPATL